MGLDTPRQFWQNLRQTKECSRHFTLSPSSDVRSRGPSSPAVNWIQRASFFAFVRGSNRFVSTWLTIETDDCVDPDRSVRATRVQGLSLVEMTRLSPLRAHTGIGPMGATANYPRSRYQVGKRKSESCQNSKMK